MMNTKKFKDTFSAVHASDALRLEVLQMCENEKKPIRLGTKILIVAAIVCLLATTALAAPAIINAIKGGRTELNGEFGPQGKPDYLPGADMTYDMYNTPLSTTPPVRLIIDSRRALY